MVRCDGFCCTESVRAEGASREWAQTEVQAKALELGWQVASDRRFAFLRDLCPDCTKKFGGEP